jgi:fido (protein-threonine AMPylation protein)
MNTIHVLTSWQSGSEQAERLCNTLLHIEGFEAIDPQCPLGGRDGLKDLVCKKDGKKWVAACFFPPTKQTVKEVIEKFEHDLGGVIKNKANGIVFFTNQPLTPGERTKFLQKAKPHDAEVYHVERIRGILDSPKGYGARLEYLRIAMETEEQISFWSAFNSEVTEKLLRQEDRMGSIDKKLDLILARTTAIEMNLLSGPSSLSSAAAIDIDFPTANLTIGQLLWIHRLLTDHTNLPQVNRGQLRSIQVWIGGTSIDNAQFVPPAPTEIPELIKALLQQWQSEYLRSADLSDDKKIDALCSFHHRFLSIHPFVDANGRVARAILQQQARELLNKHLNAEFSDSSTEYYKALYEADQGNMAALRNLITACLE